MLLHGRLAMSDVQQLRIHLFEALNNHPSIESAHLLGIVNTTQKKAYKVAVLRCDDSGRKLHLQ
jgi:hypothetical protein